MKILQITHAYAPAWHLGGVQRHITGLCQELAHLGHDVTVFTTDSGKYMRMEVPLNQAVDVEGVKVFYFKTDFFLKFAFSRDLGKACRTSMKDFDILVLWAIWHYPEIPGGFYARQERVPFVMKPSSAMMSHGLKMSRLKKWLYLNLVEFKNFRACNGIHYSALMERELTHPKISRLPSFIVPDGIDIHEFSDLPDKLEARRHFSLPADALVGVFLGRLAPIKNLANLITAVAMARGQNVDVFLVLAGLDFGEEKNLRSLTARLGLEDRVLFPGYVDQTIRKILLAAGDFLAYTTLQENFGIAIVEGMAAGLPALVSDRVGIYPEVEMDQAGIVTGIDAGSIAKGLVTMASQPSLMRTMGQNALKSAASRYDIRATAKKVERAYLDILEGIHTPDLLWSNGDQHL